MAMYTMRGESHNVVYGFKTREGKYKQQWETYGTQAEALRRKAEIDRLQEEHREVELRAAACRYTAKRTVERAVRSCGDLDASEIMLRQEEGRDNLHRTYREFMEKFLPLYARKQHFSPNTYDGYVSMLNNHILPHFGEWLMSSITAEDIDDFIDYLSVKRCGGSKSYGRRPDQTPYLSSSTVKRCYNILTVGFRTAKKWGYVAEIPDTTPPIERMGKRRAWEARRVMEVLRQIPRGTCLHLAVHLAFVCSLRAGEVVGIECAAVDLLGESFWITQIVQRVSDESLRQLRKEDTVRVFPKKIKGAKSSLILKGPKTEGSTRKQYLTRPLLTEIKGRMEVIRRDRKAFGKRYHDYGLLLCKADGTPLDPKALTKEFKDIQKTLGIQDPIDFQGLRKSGQMQKIRLSMNNYQLVAENAGQSPEVLMHHYNEVLDSEKQDLSRLVEQDLLTLAGTTHL